MTSSQAYRHTKTPALLAVAWAIGLTLTSALPARAQDVMATDPIQDGMGGATTLTPPAANNASSVAQGLTGGAQLTIDPSTGFAIGSFAFQLPTARGDAQPGLALTYNSSNATVVGFAGLGWTLRTPSIVRRGAAGLPLFTDDVFTATPAQLADPAATFDDYVVDGTALVPICAMGSCTSSQLVSGEKLPTALLGTSLTGWMYFRSEIDDRARYFFSPGGQTWIRQEQSGIVTQYGHPLDSGTVDASLSDGIERPGTSTRSASGYTSATAAYRWNIVRQSDAVGNTVYYAWTNMGSIASSVVSPGTLYLSDVYDTLAVGQAAAPASFAHHTHLTWQLGPSSGPLYTPIWRAAPMAQLSTVDVTSASWLSTTRGLVRRYNLAYTLNSQGTRNRLTSITIEGECESLTNDPTPIYEVNNVVPNPSGCPSPALLTLASYTYSPDWFNPAQDIAWPSFPDFGIAGAASRLSLVDVDGDGASDLVYPLPAGLNSIPFSGSQRQLEDPLGSVWLAYNEQTSAAVQYDYPLNFGNWLSDGFVDWLVQTPSGPTAFSPRTGTFTAGTVGGSSPFLCALGNAVDLDADGLTDCTFQLGNSNAINSLMSQRRRDGLIAPFAMTPRPGYSGLDALDWTTYLKQVSNGEWLEGLSRSMADWDGDGLPDYIAMIMNDVQTTNILVWPNHGDGGFGVNGLPGVDSAESLYVQAGFSSWQTLATVPFSTEMVTFADVNLDGIAEWILFTSEAIVVCTAGTGYVYSPDCTVVDLPALQPAGCGQFTFNGSVYGPWLDPTKSFISVSDIDGTGVPRILYRRVTLPNSTGACIDTFVQDVRLAPGNSPSLGAAPTSTFPGLLEGQTLLGGEQQTLTYQPIRSLPGIIPMPAVAWVVTNITTTNGITTSPFGVSREVTYNYTDAIYDPRDAQFVGFQSTTESHSGDIGAPGLVRTTTFATTACGPAASGVPCTGENDYGWFRAIRGLPLVTVDADTTGATNTTTTYRYADQTLYTGLDGRSSGVSRGRSRARTSGRQAARARTPSCLRSRSPGWEAPPTRSSRRRRRSPPLCLQARARAKRRASRPGPKAPWATIVFRSTSGRRASIRPSGRRPRGSCPRGTPRSGATAPRRRRSGTRPRPAGVRS